MTVSGLEVGRDNRAAVAVVLAALLLLPAAPELTRLAGAQDGAPPAAKSAAPQTAAAPAKKDAPPPPPPNPRGEPLMYEGATDVRPLGLMMWAVAAAPDGKTFATAHGDRNTRGEVLVWDRDGGKVAHTIPHEKGVRTVAYSPDGKTLVTGAFDGAVRLYDAATFALWAVGDPKAGGHTGGVNGFCFFKGGKYLATAGLDKTCRVWDVAAVAARRAAGDPVSFPPVAVFEGHTERVFSVGVSEDGLTLLSGSYDKTARAYDVPDPLPAPGAKPVVVKKERLVLQGHTSAVEAAAVSPDGQLLVTGAWDNQLLVRDRDGKNVFGGRFQSGLTSAAFTRDGKYLVAAAGNKTVPGRRGEVRVWDVEAKKEVAYRADFPETVLGIAPTPDGKTVAAAGLDRVLHLWAWADKENPPARLTAPGPTFPTQPILASALSPDGSLLAFSGDSKSVYVYDRAATKLVAELTGHADVVPGLAFSPDGKTLATAGYDKAVKLWDAATWKERAALPGHTGWVLSVAFSPDGATLATGSYDRTVRLWDAKTGDPQATWKDHSAGVRAVAFSPDGQSVASGGADRIVRVWDVSSGTVRQQLKGHKGAVRSLAFGPDGKTLVTGSEDRTVKVWNPATGSEVRTIGGLPDMVTVVRVSAKGQTVAAGTFLGPVVILDPVTGRRRQSLFSHNEAVTGAAFADDGQALVTVSQDRTIRQWAAVKPSPVAPAQTLTGTGGIPTAVAVTPDGSRAVTGGTDGSLVDWDLKTARANPLPLEPPAAGGITQVAVTGGVGWWVAAVGGDGKVRVLSLIPLRKGVSWTCDGRYAAFTPDGKQLAVADGSAVVLYDAAAGKPLRRFEGGHDGPVRCLAFSPDGKRLATAGEDTKVRLWDTATAARKQVSPPLMNFAAIVQLAFNPEGDRLAVASNSPDAPPPDDMTGNFQRVRGVYLLTVPDPAKPDWGSPLPQPLTDQTGYDVTAVAWASSRGLTTTSADGLVRMWEPDTRQPRTPPQQFRAHDGAVLAAAADGDVFLTAGEDMAVRRWRLPGSAAPGSVRLAGPFAGKPVWVAEFDPTGKYLFAAGTDLKLRVFDGTPTPSAVEFTGDVRGTFCLAYSPDGTLLASGHQGGGLYLWDTKTGKRVADLKGHTHRVWGVAFAADGKSLVSVAGDVTKGENPGDAFVWDVAEQTVRHRLTGHGGMLWSATTSPDGKTVAGACADGTVRLWDVETGRLTKTVGKHKAGVRTVAFTADGTRIVSGGFDLTVRVWDAATGEPRRVIDLPKCRPTRVAVSPDGAHLAVATRPNVPRPADMVDCVIYVYRLDDAAAPPRELKGHTGAVMNLGFLDGNTLVSTGGREDQFGEVKAWDFLAGKPVAEFRGHARWVEALAVSADGKRFATGGTSGGLPGELRQWEAGAFRPVAELPAVKQRHITAAAASPDGKTLVVAGFSDLAVFDMTDPAKPKLRRTLPRPTAGFRTVTFDADGKRFVTGGEDGNVTVWNTATLAPKEEWKVTALSVYRARFAPDGKTVVTAAGNWSTRSHGELRVWNPDTGAEVGRFPDQTREVWDFAFLDGGKTIVSAQAVGGQPNDAPIKVWDAATYKETRAVRVLSGLRCLSASADGKFVAAGNHSGEVKVIDTATWQEVLAPPAHARVVFRLGFHPDGKTLTAASEDGTVGISRLPGK